MATKYSNPFTFRQRYCDYLLKDWWHYRHTGDGIVGLKSAETVKKINENYWNIREVSYDDISFEEDNVMEYSRAFESQKPTIPKINLNRLLGKRR